MPHSSPQRLALMSVLVVAAATVLAPLASAQDDPPDRVARLNYVNGQVSFRPASLDDWAIATVNDPLTTGDHLWTDEGARAEMHLGPAVIRLAPETAFSFLNLDNNLVQARVAQGTVNVRVREMFDGDSYEIDTPNAAISLLGPGLYRVDVDPDGGRTRVIVREGQVDVNGEDRSFRVYAGDMAEIFAGDQMGFGIGRALPPDAWERWCRDRDTREDNRAALRYVSDGMVGYEDLDDYGTWGFVPEYGWTWAPTSVAVDWAPYRCGHWSHMRRWGWTWVDDTPWGFAPFHYGRWAYHQDRWLWVPGHYVQRPVWAPALVAFVGGPEWNLSFAFGTRPAVGWFPLAPGEAYHPSYRVSPRYLRAVNATHVNVTNVNALSGDIAAARYANRGVATALTAVPRDVFVNAQPVQRVALAGSRYADSHVPVVGHDVSIAPNVRSVLGASTSAVPRPPASVTARPVIARAAPSADAGRTGPVVAIGSRVATRARSVSQDAPATLAPVQARCSRT